MVGRRPRGECSSCGTDRSLNLHGLVVDHASPGFQRGRCPGSGFPPGTATDLEVRALRAEVLLQRVQRVLRRAGLSGRMEVPVSELEEALKPPEPRAETGRP